MPGVGRLVSSIFPVHMDDFRCEVWCIPFFSPNGCHSGAAFRPRSASNLRCKVFANGMAKVRRVDVVVRWSNWNWVAGFSSKKSAKCFPVSKIFQLLEFSQILMIFPKFSRSWRASPISGDKNYGKKAGDSSTRNWRFTGKCVWRLE